MWAAVTIFGSGRVQPLVQRAILLAIQLSICNFLKIVPLRNDKKANVLWRVFFFLFK